ncbi:MAG: heparinase II/III family protein [Candidatus Cryptobacteroides sp.]
MKRNNKLIALSAAILFMAGGANAQELRTEVFDMLNLDQKGLEQVKALHNEGKDEEAATALLDYYRGRKGIRTPEIKNANKVKASKTDMQWADDALNHTFFVHKGYQPSFNYDSTYADGHKEINWKYWPVKDNELRWQLHRHKWFVPMGKAYRMTKDEKYAKEWVLQYMDWIKKNPYVEVKKDAYELTDNETYAADKENARFAWRPLEVSHRLQDQCLQFQLFVDSPAFTPDFLTEFLVNYHRHAIHILNNYSDQGNHLLFEAQRMLCAGSFFPEFKEAAEWRESGVEILNKEIKVQVYPDGGQFELCPHYHLASIQIFIKSLATADLAGFRNAFPQSYIDTIEKMCEYYANICFPDYTNPCFSDAKITTKKEVLSQYKQWSQLFPDNQFIKYMATEGAEGALPGYKSKAFMNTGYFVFRNGWGTDAIQMTVKAGPPAFWHNQPDNGTFELWYNGKNLFPDSGSYVYAGDAKTNEERAWFRQSQVHNTLTMNDKNFDNTDSKTLLWQPEGDVQILVTENQSYKNLKHRRSIFFVDESYFVIVDEATGDAKGWTNLHYQMPRGKVENSREDMHFATEFEGESNMKLQVFGPEGMTMRKDKGWVSTDYKKKQQRMNVSFGVKKENSEPVRYITVIVPKKTAGDDVTISASFKDKGYSDKGMKLQVKVGKNKKTLSYSL